MYSLFHTAGEHLYRFRQKHPLPTFILMRLITMAVILFILGFVLTKIIECILLPF